MLPRSAIASAVAALLLSSCGGLTFAEYQNLPLASDGGQDPENPEEASPGIPAPQLPPPGPLATADDDQDGIADALEDYLAAGFGPEVRLAPDSEDWTRPSSVDWYLERVHMRFSHDSGCSDHEVLKLGAVTQENLSTQKHYVGKGAAWTFNCGHTTTYRYSNVRVPNDDEMWKEVFFLQPPDDATHAGSPPDDWKAYVHVKKSKFIGTVGEVGAYDIQFWFFFPYNDAFSSVNHEGDWEHVTLTVDEDLKFLSAFYSQHADGIRYSASQLRWIGNHPVVYLADGSHAAYVGPGTWDGPVVPDYAYDGGPKWETWTRFVNVGERTAPLNGQHWVKYGGRWGEIGNIHDTSGPNSPTFGGDWNTY